MEKVISHEEKIICPECSSIETGIVKHTLPWWSYVHACKNCGYIIMESEWDKAPPEVKQESKIGIGYDELPF